jgi:hypothetical protein
MAQTSNIKGPAMPGLLFLGERSPLRCGVQSTQSYHVEDRHRASDPSEDKNETNFKSGVLTMISEESGRDQTREEDRCENGRMVRPLRAIRAPRASA